MQVITIQHSRDKVFVFDNWRAIRKFKVVTALTKRLWRRLHFLSSHVDWDLVAEIFCLRGTPAGSVIYIYKHCTIR